MKAIFWILGVIQKANGWSDAQLAREMGTAPATLCRYKSGARVPGITFIKSIARMATTDQNLRQALWDYLTEDEPMV